jgi:hypothetical protein
MEERVSGFILDTKGSINYVDIIADGDVVDGRVIYMVKFGVFHEVLDESVFTCVGFTNDNNPVFTNHLCFDYQ